MDALFNQLARFHWHTEPQGQLLTGWADTDYRRDDVRAKIQKDNTTIITALQDAGFQENRDYVIHHPAFFVPGLLHRIGLQSIRLLTPEVTQPTLAARHKYLATCIRTGQRITPTKQKALARVQNLKWQTRPDESLTLAFTDLASSCRDSARAEAALRKAGLEFGEHFLYQKLHLTIPAQHKHLMPYLMPA